MLMKITTLVASLSICLAFCLPAGAQGATFDLSSFNAAAAGKQSYRSYKTGEGPSGGTHTASNRTSQQNSPLLLPITSTGGLAPVFGMGSYGWNGPWGWGGQNGGGGGANAVPPGTLATYQSTLPGSNFAYYHPLRTEVLTSDSAVYNQINADYGSLGGNYNQLANQAVAIQNQEESYAAMQGGVINYGEQAQLDGEVSSLNQQVAADYTGGF